MQGRAHKGGYTSSDNPMMSNGLARNYNDHQFAVNDPRPYQPNNNYQQNVPTGNAMKGHLTSATNPLITPDAVMMNDLYNEKNKHDRMSTYNRDKGRLGFDQPEDRDNQNKGNFQSEKQYDDIMNVKRQYTFEEQAYQNRARNREKIYEEDMKHNPRNVPYAGNKNESNKTFNLASDDNPLNNLYKEAEYTDQSKKMKEQSKYDREIVDVKVKGDPKGLLFSNETSQGNPQDTLDKSLMEYYKGVNAKIVASNPIKGSHKNKQYNPRTDGMNTYGPMF